jgi:hypothetical protein
LRSEIPINVQSELLSKFFWIEIDIRGTVSVRSGDEWSE